MIVMRVPTIEYSVLVPVYCEEESLSELSNRIAAMFAKLGKADDFEILFVDDGSTDSTADVIKTLAAERKYIRLVALRRNYGKSLALSAGLQHARGRRIVTIDADLQDSPEDIPSLLKQLDAGFDMVNGWRIRRSDTRTRRLGSRFYNWTVQYTTGLALHDMNCGLKAFTAEAAQALWLYGQYHRYLPLQIHIAGFKVTEVEVSSAPRRFGHSKFSTFRYQGAFDLLSLLFLSRYGLNPMHFFGKVAAIVIIPSLFAIGYFVVCQMLHWFDLHDPVLNRPLLSFSLMSLLLGITIFLTGFVCDFMLHHQIRDRLQRVVSFAVAGVVDEQSGRKADEKHAENVR